jgi:hypothetical protein
MQSSDLYVLSLPASRGGPEAWKTFSWLLAFGVQGRRAPVKSLHISAAEYGSQCQRCSSKTETLEDNSRNKEAGMSS